MCIILFIVILIGLCDHSWLGIKLRHLYYKGTITPPSLGRVLPIFAVRARELFLVYVIIIKTLCQTMNFFHATYNQVYIIDIILCMYF